jgi:CRP/FNR family transcriptional regulator, cyclic AMP receptor protein
VPPTDDQIETPVKVLGVFKAASETREVPAGTVIFEEGSTGDEMFGVVEGRVELRLSDGSALTIGPDDTFGEMALVDSSPRSATATAVEDSKLAVIDKRRFLFLVGETPTFALQVMSSLAHRLRAVQHALAERDDPSA